MKEHILLENAHRYAEPSESIYPDGYLFQEIQGYWTNSTTGEVMMLSEDPRRPLSKKCDRETGEDQKGE